MNQQFSLNTPLHSYLLPQATLKKAIMRVLLYCFGLGLLTVSSKIAIALQPVPMTLQTLAVLLIGMVYGARLGAITVASFVVFGLLGMPILAGAITTGVSLGYIIGFVPAAFIAGLLAQRGWGRSKFSSALAALIGMVIIYMFGLIGLTSFMGFSHAMAVGFIPFILPMIAKVTVLAIVVPRFWKI